MRNLLYVLLLFAASLAFSWAERPSDAPAVRHAPQTLLSASDARADQWQCERTSNSDLLRPQFVRPAESCPMQLLPRSSASVPALRALPRPVVSAGCVPGVARLIATFPFPDLFVGVRAVDFYVYRLRRLII
ncbi:MAG TPA: hypothetical protein H9879_03625 [Candidatus Alistipes intestinipullorum]|nr:hypothetical protein [Candidatus Alistipes intestinipullorum]